MSPRSLDPLRAAWLRGDYAQAIRILDQPSAPLASTCRRILGPKKIWSAVKGSDWTSREGHSTGLMGAMVALALRLPQSLASHPSIAGDMRANGSIKLLAHALANYASFGARAGSGAAAERFEKALFSTLALDEGIAHGPGLWCGIHGPKAIFEQGDAEEPFWTCASNLEGACAERLLALAEEKGALNPSAAWGAMASSHVGRDPRPTMALARRATASTAREVGVACTKIALACMDPHPSHPVAEWLALASQICDRHRDLPGALSCEAIIGSLPPTADPKRPRWERDPYSTIRPPPFRRRHTRRPEPGDPAEPERAADLLLWLDGCAELCARLDLSDIGAPLANQRLEEAYASLCEGVAEGAYPAGLPTGFPLGAPSLAEAFNSRKLASSLGSLPAGSLPTRPRSI